MNKFLLACLLLIICKTNLCAQQSKDLPAGFENSYEYYIRVSGINSRQDVEDLQHNISKKAGINFFMANRYPVRYFRMRSKKIITAIQFEQWLNNLPYRYRLEFFGEGNKGKEQATLLYNKTKAQ